MGIEIVLGDITKSKCEAIVNAANNTLLGGGGVDGAIHSAAGSRLIEECKTLGGCETGQAKITRGYDLEAKYIIHTVGPRYMGGDFNEAKLLENCYINAFELALKQGVESIAFPSISTGIYGYPIEKAVMIAMKVIYSYIEDFSKIEIVCFDEDTYENYNGCLRTYIEM